MKITKIASGKTKLKLTKQEWMGIGKQAQWGVDDIGQAEEFSSQIQPAIEAIGSARMQHPRAHRETLESTVIDRLREYLYANDRQGG